MAVDIDWGRDLEPPEGKAAYGYNHSKGANPDDIEATVAQLSERPDQWVLVSPDEGWTYSYSASWAIRLRRAGAEVRRWCIKGKFRAKDSWYAVRARMPETSQDG